MYDPEGDALGEDDEVGATDEKDTSSQPTRLQRRFVPTLVPTLFLSTTIPPIVERGFAKPSLSEASLATISRQAKVAAHGSIILRLTCMTDDPLESSRAVI
jgi:hypothetical protein